MMAAPAEPVKPVRAGNDQPVQAAPRQFAAQRCHPRGGRCGFGRVVEGLKPGLEHAPHYGHPLPAGQCRPAGSSGANRGLTRR